MCLCVGVVVSLVAGQTRDRVLGPWLESIRTSTLVEHVERSGGQVAGARGETIDDDDDALAAYNDMLERLGRPDKSR
jgi:hypothetical protein